MKRIFLALMMIFVSLIGYTQEEESISGTKIVLDSTVVNDMKLLIIHERLYSENGLVNAVVKEASKEKAETGDVKKAQATQSFLDKLGKDYQDYFNKFIKVDTVYVDSIKLENQIKKITEWQQKVLNDPDIKDATNLGIWERKNERLNKLLRYRSQF